MKRALRIAGLAAALSVATAPVASASTTLVNGTFCGGNTFSTCAFINSSSETSGGNTVLTLTVTNPVGNNAGSVFTAIGIANLPLGSSVTTGAVASASPGVNFTYAPGGPTGLNGAGIGGDVVGFGANSPAPANGVHVGETITFTFTFNGVYDLGSIQYALHDQGGAPADCDRSTKLVVNAANGQYSANTASCSPPVTTAPEPASLTLLATGIVGLGGFVRRRAGKTAA